MLFHNRPVKAAMGSVIVNGGVQLNAWSVWGFLGKAPNCLFTFLGLSEKGPAGLIQD